MHDILVVSRITKVGKECRGVLDLARYVGSVYYNYTAR